MEKILVSARAAQKLRAAYPLLMEEDFLTDTSKEGIVEIADERENFIGIGYLSKQNKGSGWLLTRNDQPIDHAFYLARFLKAKKRRQRFFEDEQTTAFRLFNGEGDGLGGLTVDLYADYAVFSWYNAFIYRQREQMIAAFQKAYPEIKGAYEKIRFDSTVKFESQQIYGRKAPEPLIVLENGVSYATYLNEGLMTGIFLDQKNVRKTLANGLAVGKTVLNMFSYTGAFSVAAAMGGSVQTTSVDLAKRSLEKTQEQFKVNGIDPDTQKIYVMDVFRYFNYARKKKLHYDLIVLDPPSFARNGKKTFSVAKNYGELLEDAIDILEEDGVVIASTNAANVSRKKFRQMVEKALKEKKTMFEIYDEESLPEDFHIIQEFPEGNYLKVLFIQIKNRI